MCDSMPITDKFRKVRFVTDLAEHEVTGQLSQMLGGMTFYDGQLVEMSNPVQRPVSGQGKRRRKRKE